MTGAMARKIICSKQENNGDNFDSIMIRKYYEK